MNFDIFAKRIDEIEKKTSRNEISEILANFFKELTPEEAKNASYLLLGSIGPNYQSQRFNLAEKNIVSFVCEYISQIFSQESSQEFLELNKKTSDPGQAIYSFLTTHDYTEAATRSEPLSFTEIYNSLSSLACLSGERSVTLKMNFFLNTFSKLSPLEMKYFIRIITGNLQLGVSTATLLESFSIMKNNDKNIKKDLEANYNVCADVGRIIFLLKTNNLNALKNPQPIFGVPVSPAAAERVKNLDELITRMKQFVIQPKLDGLRVQIHRFEQNEESSVVIFSRNLLDLTESFPDIALIFKNNFCGNFILDGELIAFDKHSGKNLPFQETIKRRRKNNIESFLESTPVKIYLFDILKQGEQSLLTTPYHTRRDILVENFDNKNNNILITPETQIDLTGIEENDTDAINKTQLFLENYFSTTIHDGFEGFVAKNSNSIYQAGKRGFAWIKVKEVNAPRLGDTIDAVIIGCYFGKGRRTKFGVGALLMAVFDPIQKTFQTIGKVGTGLSDENLKTITNFFEKKQLDIKPNNYDVHKNLYPDFWVQPELVLELEADEITLSEIHSAGKNLLSSNKGLSLRFPRVKSFRYDKSAEQATTTEEILKISNLKNTIKHSDI